jgi:hypothetical protein
LSLFRPAFVQQVNTQCINFSELSNHFQRN